MPPEPPAKRVVAFVDGQNLYHEQGDGKGT
jgi:hypothetical protein